jgi:uncharacterized membrane protein YtjA (UPF0391 family)
VGDASGPAAARRRLHPCHEENAIMLKWAIIFAVLAVVLGLLGFTGIAGAFMGIAKILFWLAVIIFVVLLVLGVTVFKKVT